MANKLMIILHNSDPTRMEELGAPLFQAAVAAAMQYEVEVIFSGRTAELTRKGVAESIYMVNSVRRSLYDCMREAVEAGAVLKVCSAASDLWRDDMIPEIQEIVGSAYLISEAMDQDTVTFTY